MVKWKKMNKKMAGLLLGVMMLFTASTTAFAYVDESADCLLYTSPSPRDCS